MAVRTSNYVTSEFVPAQHAEALGARTVKAMAEKVRYRVIRAGDPGGDNMPVGFSILLIIALDGVRGRVAIKRMATAFLSGQLSGLSLSGAQVNPDRPRGDWHSASASILAHAIQ